MLTVIDVIGEYECVECSDLAAPGQDRCTSCAAWQDHGILPTTLLSARAAAYEAAAACCEGDSSVELDAVTRQIADRLHALEVRSGPDPARTRAA